MRPEVPALQPALQTDAVKLTEAFPAEKSARLMRACPHMGLEGVIMKRRGSVYHPHALRHFAATSWLRGGAGLDEVRWLLGHESLTTTLRDQA